MVPDLNAVAVEAERRHRRVLQQVIELYEQQCRQALDTTNAEARRAIGYQADEANRGIARQRDEIVHLKDNVQVADACLQMRGRRIVQLGSKLAKMNDRSRSLVDEAIATMTSRMDAKDAPEHYLCAQYDAQRESNREMTEALRAVIGRLLSEVMPPGANDFS